MLLKFRHISCLIVVSFVWVAMVQAEEALQILENEQKTCANRGNLQSPRHL